MSENLFEIQYDVTKKHRLKKFYNENKILIFSVLLFFLISIFSFGYYFETKKNKKIILANSYIEAKAFLLNDEKEKAKNVLKAIIDNNGGTYSVLSLFLIIDENLITENAELVELFDRILENNEFEEEIKNLIIFKKTLLHSNFANERDLFQTAEPLISNETIWKPHVLMLFGDYFSSKNEYSKAREYYNQVLSSKNVHVELYEQVRLKLTLISND